MHGMRYVRYVALGCSTVLVAVLSLVPSSATASAWEDGHMHGRSPQREHYQPPQPQTYQSPGYGAPYYYPPAYSYAYSYSYAYPVYTYYPVYYTYPCYYAQSYTYSQPGYGYPW